MGLYLCIYQGDEELDGVEVGSYGDYGHLIDTVVRVVEKGNRGSRCPTLVLHSDCDGVWSAEDASRLEEEVATITDVFLAAPPVPFESEWQKDVAKKMGLAPANLFESFIDVDGESLLERIRDLARLSMRTKLSIYFQ